MRSLTFSVKVKLGPTLAIFLLVSQPAYHLKINSRFGGWGVRGIGLSSTITRKVKICI